MRVAVMVGSTGVFVGGATMIKGRTSGAVGTEMIDSRVAKMGLGRIEKVGLSGMTVLTSRSGSFG